MEQHAKMEWGRRLERAIQLRDDLTDADQVLGFYQNVLQVQLDIAKDLAAQDQALVPKVPLREQIGVEIPLQHLKKLIEVTERYGPTTLASAAQEIARREKGQIREFLISALQGAGMNDPEPEQSTVERFFSLALLQPSAEYLSKQATEISTSENRCPQCGALPLLAVLRPEGDGAKRFLQCSFCLAEWAFRRVLCPWCGETDKDKLPRYSADECTYVRVEACDSCKRYLKSVDLTVNGLAVPLVDELGLAALDVWANERSYKKITPNLLGF